MAQEQEAEQGAERALPSSMDAKRRFEILHHPWRIRILEVLSERDMSTAQFVDEGLLPDIADLERSEAISRVAYHFRALRNAGLIEIIDQVQRRGSTELVCRGRAPAYHTDEDWAELPLEKRQPITEVTLDGLIARARAAVLFHSFDTRTDRHLSSVPMDLDEEGWAELVEAMAGMLGRVIQIRHDARKRLAASEGPPLRVTYGQMGFPSAPLPSMDDDQDDRQKLDRDPGESAG